MEKMTNKKLYEKLKKEARDIANFIHDKKNLPKMLDSLDRLMNLEIKLINNYDSFTISQREEIDHYISVVNRYLEHRTTYIQAREFMIRLDNRIGEAGKKESRNL